MNLYGIFPTPVAKFELGRDFTSTETDFLFKLDTEKNVGNTVSSNRYVLRNDTLSNLREFVQSSVDEYLNTVYAPKTTSSIAIKNSAVSSGLDGVKLRITQSWVNYSKPGQWHHNHCHPNSFVSGVLYLKAAKERDRINFSRGRYEQIKLPTEDWNLYNSETWWFTVSTGELIIFPSYLEHNVNVVEVEERISLSFNTFPVGRVGHEESLTALYLE